MWAAVVAVSDETRLQEIRDQAPSWDDLVRKLVAAEAALVQAEKERDKLIGAILERRCNGCGAPAKTWGPTYGGMYQGDNTHYHSAEWWAQCARAAAGETAPSEADGSSDAHSRTASPARSSASLGAAAAGEAPAARERE